MDKEEKLKKIGEMMKELMIYADEKEIDKLYISLKFTLESYKELYGDKNGNNSNSDN